MCSRQCTKGDNTHFLQFSIGGIVFQRWCSPSQFFFSPYSLSHIEKECMFLYPQSRNFPNLFIYPFQFAPERFCAFLIPNNNAFWLEFTVIKGSRRETAIILNIIWPNQDNAGIWGGENNNVFRIAKLGGGRCVKRKRG